MWIYYVFFPNWVLKAFLRASIFGVCLAPTFIKTMWYAWKEVYYKSLNESAERFNS